MPRRRVDKRGAMPPTPSQYLQDLHLQAALRLLEQASAELQAASMELQQELELSEAVQAMAASRRRKGK